MNTLKALKTRRSCRAYTSEPVAPELLDQIIEAGTYAPTGMGRQSPIIVAITNKEVRDRLSRIKRASWTVKTTRSTARPPCSWCSHARMWARTCTTAAGDGKHAKRCP